MKNSAIIHQFEAALAMLDECLEKCPLQHWNDPIAKYPFWQVAYHTLCFVDLYLERDEKGFTPGPMHPAGWKEFDEEYPSRSFDCADLRGYVQLCRRKAHAIISTETPVDLDGPSGHARRKFTRFEMHLYNLRHLQHHTGQLSAFLRRVNVDTRWIGSGWPA